MVLPRGSKKKKEWGRYLRIDKVQISRDAV